MVTRCTCSASDIIAVAVNNCHNNHSGLNPRCAGAASASYPIVSSSPSTYKTVAKPRGEGRRHTPTIKAKKLYSRFGRARTIKRRSFIWYPHNCLLTNYEARVENSLRAYKCERESRRREREGSIVSMAVDESREDHGLRLPNEVASVTDTTSTDETTPVDSGTSRGESPSPNYAYGQVTVGVCAMNKKVLQWLACMDDVCT